MIGFRSWTRRKPPTVFCYIKSGRTHWSGRGGTALISSTVGYNRSVEMTLPLLPRGAFPMLETDSSLRPTSTAPGLLQASASAWLINFSLPFCTKQRKKKKEKSEKANKKPRALSLISTETLNQESEGRPRKTAISNRRRRPARLESNSHKSSSFLHILKTGDADQ